MNKFQSFILIRSDHSIIIAFFVLFYKFLFLCTLFCSNKFAIGYRARSKVVLPILDANTTSKIGRTPFALALYSKLIFKKNRQCRCNGIFCVETRSAQYKTSILTVERLVRMGRKNYYKYSTQDLGASLYSHL